MRVSVRRACSGSAEQVDSLAQSRALRARESKPPPLASHRVAVHVRACLAACMMMALIAGEHAPRVRRHCLCPNRRDATHAASDLFGIDRLKLLLLSQGLTPPSIRLIEARALLKYVSGGRRMYRRQHMEEHHPEILCKEEFVERLLADLERIDREQLDRGPCERFYQCPGIVALCYAMRGSWATATGQTLTLTASSSRLCSGSSSAGCANAPTASYELETRCMMVWRLSERKRRGFMGLMSLFQPPSAARTAQQAFFGAAQCNIGVLCCRARTALWKLTATATADELQG